MRHIVVAIVVATFGLACGTGGGGGTGGGTGGGSGGGATGGGTGGGSTSGVLTFSEVGFDSPSIASSSDGAVHLAYTYGVTPAHVVYRRCTGNCERPESWQGIDLGGGVHDLANYVRLAVAGDGRVHVVWEASDTGGSTQTMYATCASNCLEPSSWSAVDITSLLMGTSAPYRGAPMVVDSSGRLSLITSSLTFNATVVLSTCASNCATLGSWSSGIIRTGGSRSSLVAVGTALHLVMNNESGALIYRTCSGNCTLEASWQESPPLFAHGETPPVSLAATASGGLRVAYNQGSSLSTEPPAVQMQDDRVLVWSCDANCLVPASWSGVILGDLRDGEDGLALTSLGESLALVVTTTDAQTVTVRACDANCTDAASWTSGIADSSNLMNADVDPYAAIGCTDSSGAAVRPSFASWYPYKPVITLTAAGATVVHAPYLLRTCPGVSSSTRLPGVGRLRALH